MSDNEIKVETPTATWIFYVMFTCFALIAGASTTRTKETTPRSCYESARALLARFATSLGFTTMTVDFVSTKSWLVKFYEKMGFQVVEEKTTQSLSVPPILPVLPLCFARLLIWVALLVFPYDACLDGSNVGPSVSGFSQAPHRAGASWCDSNSRN